jgi:PKHD-type hydroxylase
MKLTNNYWYFSKTLSDDVCDSIIQQGLKQNKKLALTEGLERDKLSKKEIAKLKKKRDSHIAWLNDEELYSIITPYIFEANRNAGWNFDVDWFESIQFTIYNKKQYYDWHQDSISEPYKGGDPNFDGKIRKISAVVSLSNPLDYIGGNFKFSLMDDGKKERIISCKEIKERGTIVVFPSHMWHTVTPVTKGTRYSLVIWGLGKPFK